MHTDSSICCKNKRQRASETAKRSYREVNTSASDSDRDSDDNEPLKRKTKKAKPAPLPTAPKPTVSIPKTMVGKAKATKSTSANSSGGGSSKRRTSTNNRRSTSVSLSEKLLDLASRSVTVEMDNLAPNNGIGSKDDIVCTPDLFEFLNQNLHSTLSGKVEEPPPLSPVQTAKPVSTTVPRINVPSSLTVRPLSTMTQAQARREPPPLVVRQSPTPANRPLPTQTSARPTKRNVNQNQTQQYVINTPNAKQTILNRNAPSTINVATSSSNPATPIYHTINGFRVDLNTAAQHSTYRLPNGNLFFLNF